MTVVDGVLGAAILTAAFLLAYRWIRVRSRTIAWAFAAVVLVRLAAGVLLTSLAWLDSPFLEHLRYPDGIWQFAPDARTYQRGATTIVNEGIGALEPSMPARTYVVLLALWMEVVGPALAGFTLNLLLFIGYAALAVRVLGPRPGALSELAALVLVLVPGLAPSAVLHSTQPLKDELAAFLIAVSCFCAVRVFGSGGPSARRAWLAVVLAAAIGVLAGVRSHMAAMIIAALVCGGMVYVLQHLRGRVIGALAVASIAVGLSCATYLVGAQRQRLLLVNVAETTAPRPGVVPSGTPGVSGSKQTRGRGGRATTPGPRAVYQQRQTGTTLRSVTTFPARAVAGIRKARQAFIRSGGRTNLARRGEPKTIANDVRALGVGLAATFVPISLLNASGFLSVGGGQGLLFLTNVDTLFLDLGVLVTAVMLVRHGRNVSGSAAVRVFTAVYAAFALFLLAYVVTNYGTLFRMRLMMVQGVCLLLLVFAANGRCWSERVGANLARRRPADATAGSGCTPAADPR